ncbi:MAG TPA: HAD family phosphatase [Pirellulales bacterium]|nr:HAD family phosphatase [Pirellulales bacterium]
MKENLPPAPTPGFRHPASDIRPPKFIYFDLGNVLLYFDHRRAARQMATVAGVPADLVWDVVFASGLEHRYEAGELSTQEFFEIFCDKTGSRPDYAALAAAAGDIFEVNAPLVELVSQLSSAGRRLGLLSNTCEWHWNHFAGGRYPPIPEAFHAVVLSFRAKAMKPDVRIYALAAEMAGAAPSEIFFVDDMPGHVAAARAFGFDAVQYTSPEALVAELAARGVG